MLTTPPRAVPGLSRLTEKLRPQFFPRLAVGHADARRARDRRARAMAAQAATLSSDDGSAPADALVDYLRMANTADVLAAIRASAGVGGAEDGDGDGDANGDGDGDARSAREGGLEGFGAAAQRALVAILEHPISVLHPPGRAYRARLLKAAALAAERSGDDLDDRLAEAHAATLVAPDDDGWCHKTFAYGPSHLAVTVRAHVNLFEGGTGCHEWPAGFYLAEIAATHPHIFAGRRVVELGAGTGITAAVVARPPATPAKLTLCDSDLDSLVNLARNLEMNGVRVDETPATGTGTVSTLRVDWDDFDPSALAELRADLVIGADILYDPLSIPGLLAATGALLRRENSSERAQVRSRVGSDVTEETASSTRAVFVSALRQPETLRKFEDAAREAGFEPRDVTESLRVDKKRGFRRCEKLERSEFRVHLLSPPADP